MIALAVVVANALFMLPVGLLLPDAKQLCEAYFTSNCGAKPHTEVLFALVRLALFARWAQVSVLETRQRWRDAFVVVLIMQLLAVALITTTTIRSVT